MKRGLIAAMCAVGMMGMGAAMFLTGCATIPLERPNMLSSYKTASGMVTTDVWTGSTVFKDTVWTASVSVDKDKFDNFAQGCQVIVAFTRSSSATYHKLQFNVAYPTGAAEMKNGVYEGGKYDSVHGGVDLNGKTLTYTVTDADANALKENGLVIKGYGVTVTKVTVIAEEETATDAEYTSKPKMEFIGFKASSDNIPTGVANTSVSDAANLVLWGKKVSRTDVSNYDAWKMFKADNTLSRFGNTLESKNIAIDKSSPYEGDYSMREMEYYKSSARYVTFVQVNKNNLTWYGKDSRVAWGNNIGWPLAVGIPMTIVGACYPSKVGDTNTGGIKAVFLVPGIALDLWGMIGAIGYAAETKNIHTTFEYDGSFDIIVYDTQTKEVAKKVSDVRVNPDPLVLKGFCDGDSEKVAPYYASIINSTILHEYTELQKWVESRE